MPFPDLPERLAQALAERGYAEPTPVQAAVLDPATAGRDLLVSAQTGSGKTVAFGLAVAEQVLEAGRSQKPLALIIAPTRELAMQVREELAWLYAGTGARVIACVGGTDVRADRRALGMGAEIVVGTPGRLRDHLERNNLDLSALRAAVLDEADEMLDMGFRDDLEAILEGAPETRRTLMFSATVPREIVALRRPTSAAPCASRQRWRASGMATSPIAPCWSGRERSRPPWSMRCAGTRPAARWSSATPASRSIACMAAWSSVGSPRSRCPAN